MVSPVLSSMLPQGFIDFSQADGFKDGAARSRSTSAGGRSSSMSDSQGSIHLHQSLLSPPLSPPVYAADTLGLPEYDYPTPWSIQNAPPLPGVEYPMPFIMKNTFMGFDVCRPPSLEGFYEERAIKSCPASGIGLPPGLEDFLEPDNAAARLVAAEAVLHREMKIAETQKEEQPAYHLPDGLFDAPADREFSDWYQSLPLHPPSSAPRGQQFDFQRQSSLFSPTLQAAQPLPLLLDSLVSVLPAQENCFYPQQVPLQAPFFDTRHVTPEVPVPPAAWAPQPQPNKLELGSPECPTMGSEGHRFGTCRPCAFLFTKGCSNGVMCSFCHLCDAGEKKKRMREKRAVIKNARQWGC